MLEQREPWLRLPDEKPGAGTPRPDPRFRTHIVAVQRPAIVQPEIAPERPTRLSSSPERLESVLPLRTEWEAGPDPAAIERAAARAAVPKPVARRSVEPGLPMVEHPVSRHAEPSLSGAPPLELEDLSSVSSADWVAKVSEVAKMVDVIVVFYTSASRNSGAFRHAFQSVINEVLPRIDRPYTAYRFSLDAEPAFVGEMAGSWGLAEENPITVAGFAWSGPGRQLLLIGDQALKSRTALSRFVRRIMQRTPTTAERGVRQEGTAGREPLDRAERSRAPLRRPLIILAWCLLGTAALGAVVMGVAPQLASPLFHSATLPGPGPVGSTGARGATGAAAPAATPPVTNPGAAIGAAAGSGAQAPANPSKPSTPARTHKKRPAGAVSSDPTYWGLPEPQLR